MNRNQLHVTLPNTVTVTFHRQKNGVKETEITMHKANAPLCPVRAFRSIILRLMKYPGESGKSTINTVKYGNEIVRVTSKVMIQHMRNTVDLLGKENLGFTKNDVGIHSIRSSFAMFIILNGIEPAIVQLQGRWKSAAFMDYVRPQVSDFSRGLSEIMTRDSEFYTVPEQQNINNMNIRIRPTVSFINNNLFNL